MMLLKPFLREREREKAGEYPRTRPESTHKKMVFIIESVRRQAFRFQCLIDYLVSRQTFTHTEKLMAAKLRRSHHTLNQEVTAVNHQTVVF